MPIRFVIVLSVLCSAALAQEQFPRVETVERQPLLSQVTRLDEALQAIGSPLDAEVHAALERLKSLADDKAVAAEVQTLLDPLCLVAIDLSGETPKVTGPGKTSELFAEGWRAFLVKVVNPEGATGGLRIDSPNAAPVPRSPADAVESRWLGLESYEGQPLRTKLSGLPLEYRIVQLYSRDVGERSATLTAAVVESDEQKDAPSGSADLKFKAVASTPVSFAVTDGGEPAMAAFEIRDALGRVYPLQSKRLAPDFFFHPQVYRATGETVQLPPGSYTVRCSRGPESIHETQSLVVEDRPVTLTYDVKRWIDTAKLNYWSGDHHIHAAGCQHYDKPTEGVLPADMLRHCKGEDLKVGCCLTWGPCFDFQKQFFTGKTDDVSEYPYLLRYDIEVSGFGSHNSGHLNLLKLKDQIYPGGDSKLHWPTLGLNTLTWAKSQGAVCGPAHSAAGLTRTVGRLEGTDGLDGPHRLPNYDIPAYDGIGANEFIVDITHEVPGPEGKLVPAVDFISTMNTDRVAEWNMWYHALNCGYRVKASGETDFPCITGERVGIGRVYAKVDGRLEFDRWVEALAAGRSYVSDGSCHLMNMTAEPAGDASRKVSLGENGSELRTVGPSSVKVRVTAAAFREGSPSLPVELIVNGYVADQQDLVADGTPRDLEFDAQLDRSSWVAVRVFPHAHTNPIFAIVDGKPIRPSKESAEWCLKGVEQCWSQKLRTYREEEREGAKTAYDHAREAYQQIIAEAEPTARPE
ncbi:MAG: CehA/McbA family metallohydrolase [Planctomycetaceae bacterium]|nr:CehA/McbA family metallohydrolase [Planctomycetaceae bacterium]